MAPNLSPNLIIALVVLPLVGALIAWAGDVIGYRLGRSRRSLFGLRPRATARLVGVFVGAVLPLAGLAFAMAVSQDARDAILRIRQLRQETITLSRDKDALTAERTAALQEARTARSSARSADTERMKAEERLAATQQALDANRALLHSVQADLAGAKAHLATARADLSRAQGDLAKAQGDLAKAQGDLTKAQGDLAKARGDLTKAQGDLTKARGDLEQAQADLSEAQEDLSATEEDLAVAQKQMQSLQAELENLAALERSIAAAQEHLGTLETELARNQDRLAETRHALDRYRIAARAIIEQEVAFEPGDEIIRAIVEADRTVDQLEAILDELLNFAGAAAMRHGIAVGPTGRAVRIVAPVPPEAMLTRITEGEIIREVARRISAGEAPNYVVIIRAWGRVFENQAEPMTAEFWVAPNRVVFHAGEVILTTDIDGGLPRAHVFRNLWQTMTDIRRIAANRGMLPSPKTGRYGEVPAEELLDALDRILDIGGPATVRMIVVNDTRVAQPEEMPMMIRLTVSAAEKQ